MEEEHKELSTKLAALNGFIYSNQIFKELSDIDQALMIKQAGFMESYARVLSERIWSAKT